MNIRMKSAILSHIKKMSVGSDAFWQKNELQSIQAAKFVFGCLKSVS